MTASEVAELDIAEMGSLINHFALPWMELVDTEPFIRDVRRLLAQRGIEVVASTHGLPITDLESVMPQIYDGMRQAAVI